MINKDLELILNATLREAKSLQHEYATIEHILYAIVHDEYGAEIIENCGGDVEQIKKELKQFFKDYIPRIKEPKGDYPILSVGFQRVIRNAINFVQLSSKKEVDAGDLLVYIYDESDSYSSKLLKSYGITRLDILNYISHGISKINPYSKKESFNNFNYSTETKPSNKDLLQQFTTELVALAQKGKLSPLIGRDLEIKMAIHILSRKRKNNVIFVGEPGVGKTAIVEGLAQRIACGNVPDCLKNAKIYSLDLGGLLAGTQFRGDFESRLKGIINALLQIPNAILFIDEIHTIVGAGATSNGTLDASNILKPYLNSGMIHCIGATTYEEYKRHFEKDRALTRRFQKIDVLEPSIEETYNILKGVKRYYEEFHKVTYSDKALHAAVELSAKYINDRHLPDKAIDIVDEVGAKIKLSNRKNKVVTVKDIEETVAEIARIPSKTISISEIYKLSHLEEELKKVIFGQDDAIKKVVQAIKRSRAGLGNQTSPIGSFLFTGPTGVGKTELAKQLAKILGIQFLRFDMSEFMEKHAVSRLIGAPPGYVGFEQGGLLTDSIRKHPHAVLLLDEIEKAHPDIFNILLQIMDYATLTDHNGKKADFRNVILIMTSNVGAKEMEETPIGFGNRKDESKVKGLNSIQKLFSPEFRNRLDAIVNFNHLDNNIMLNIVDKFLNEIRQLLKEKKIILNVSEKARLNLAEKGFDKHFGARPIKRLIEEEITNRITDELLFGKIKKGGIIWVDLKDGQITLNFTNDNTQQKF